MITQLIDNPGKTYRKFHSRRMHRSLVASLVIVLTFSFFARHIELRKSDLSQIKLAELEALQVEIIKRLKKPMTKVLPPVQKIDIAAVVPEKIETPIKAVPENNRRKVESVDLKLSDVSANLLNHSALNQLSRLSAERGRNSGFDASQSIGANLDVGRLSSGPSNLDFDVGTTMQTRDKFADAPKVSLSESEPLKSKRPEKNPGKTDTDFLQADVSVVLASSDINIDINEYPLWNRINAEFDRWDKGRYGALHDLLKKQGRTIIADLGFADGTSHKIIWKRGTTKIIVQGKSKRNRIDELKQAVAALTRLNLNQIRS
ncbi:MAG: hypothetical protein DWQ05_01705 [Calditrichaeota bacterium]|nr:MAG: hypothetical protein DWQ05_01705 [Calditrichota bacterium]